jgi:hypothetical protein
MADGEADACGFAFIGADKSNDGGCEPRCLVLVRLGRLIAMRCCADAPREV